MHRILLTCPPMIGLLHEFNDDFRKVNFDVSVPNFTQVMEEQDLINIIGNFDGWIIGDDPATREVIKSGKAGKLKACMRWGVGTNNVDFEAFKDFNIPIENTPKVFGREVADLAMHYVTGLARKTFEINEKVKNGEWFKPVGMSLWAARAGIIGFGDVGCNLAQRLTAHGVEVSYYDPYVSLNKDTKAKKENWPEVLNDKDFIIFTAPLTEQTYHMFNRDVFPCLKQGVKIVNVGRGPLIKEQDLLDALNDRLIDSVALDVQEQEPFDPNNELLEYGERVLLGSHNGSNTYEAVVNVSRICINKLNSFLLDR